MTLINNRYEIIHTLARGGFGQTFLAVDTHLPSQPHCVIKQLKPLKEANGTTENELKMRFGKEAIVLEKLGANHPQIPSLYAYFTQNDEFYLVQEYIEGETLRQRVQRTGVLTEQEAEKFLLGILPVLVYTHGHQIVHRDIKPDNIIIRDRDKLPVLIDFGVIKEVMASTVLSNNGEPQPSLPFGTPGYMASEQAAGRPMFNSDLYSLGLTVIFLLTGKDPHQLITDVHSGELVWQGEIPHLSPGFGQIIQQAVAFHPRDRYDSAQTMLNAVTALANSGTNIPTMVAAPIPPSLPRPSQSTVAASQKPPQGSTGVNKTLVASPPQPTLASGKSSSSSSTLGLILLIPLMVLGGVAVGIVFFNMLIPGTNSVNTPEQVEPEPPTPLISSSAEASSQSSEEVIPEPEPEPEPIPEPTPEPEPEPEPAPEPEPEPEPQPVIIKQRALPYVPLGSSRQKLIAAIGEPSQVETLVDSGSETVQALIYNNYLSLDGDLMYEWVVNADQIFRKQVIFSEQSSQSFDSMVPTLTELLDNQVSSLAEEKLAAIVRRDTDLLTFEAKGKSIQIGLNGENRIFISVQ